MDEYYEVIDDNFIREQIANVWGEDWNKFHDYSVSDLIDAFRLGMKFADVGKSG